MPIRMAINNTDNNAHIHPNHISNQQIIKIKQNKHCANSTQRQRLE